MSHFGGWLGAQGKGHWAPSAIFKYQIINRDVVQVIIDSLFKGLPFL